MIGRAQPQYFDASGQANPELPGVLRRLVQLIENMQGGVLVVSAVDQDEGSALNLLESSHGRTILFSPSDARALRDVGERFEGTCALLEQAQRVAGIGAWVWELADDRLWWSPEAYRIFGVAENIALSERSLWSLVHPEDVEAVKRVLASAIEGQRRYDVEHRIVRPDGSTRWLHVCGSVIYDAATGAAVRLLGVVQDITDDKRLHGQLAEAQKMEALGRLAGGIAHDFNNMLSAIQGFACFIHESLPELDPMREDAAQIMRASTRAAALTRQLLAFSRRQMLEPKIVDLREQVHEVEKLLVRLLPEHSRLHISMPAELDRIKVDPGQLEQVILNLVVNAGEAMPNGGVIGIAAENVALDANDAAVHPEVRPGRYVMLAVSDNGVGIPEALRARIFEPFFTTKERGKGTGLGLATVLGIVRQSGGHVRVDSEPGRGTVFRVYFPFTSDVKRSSPAPASRDMPLGSGETILVVEDDASVRELVRRVLDRAGFSAVVAADPQEALHVGLECGRELAMLVTDVVMPGMNGYDLAESLRAHRPELVTVFMSGYPESTVLGGGVRRDGMLFVAKPLDPTLLLDKVRDGLRLRRKPAAPTSSVACS